MSPQIFLLTIGAGLLAAVVGPVITGTYQVIPAVLAAVAAVACIALAVLWKFLPAPQPGSFRAGIQTAASDFRWWFVIIAAIWSYQVITHVITEVRRNHEIASLRNDVQAIANVIERGVLPRHLTRRQQASMIGFLRQFPSYEVNFKVISANEEASSYRADIQEVLTKAGWKIGRIDYSGDLQEGLKTNFTQTMAHSQAPEDRNSPRPDRLFQMALGLAGVRWEGGGGSSGVHVTEDSFTIEIGRVRRDSYTIDPPMGFP